MRKISLFVLVAVLLIAAAGCSIVSGAGDDGPPEITGLIFTVDSNQILVVAGIEDATIPYDEWFETGNRAVFFTVTEDTVIKSGKEKVSVEKLEKGQKVQVWADGPLMESYPEQGSARKIIIVAD